MVIMGFKVRQKDIKHEITRKEDINSENYLIEVKAPLVAERFRAGHFVVLLTHPRGE